MEIRCILKSEAVVVIRDKKFKKMVKVVWPPSHLEIYFLKAPSRGGTTCFFLERHFSL